MDLTSLYTPEELARTRCDFLKKILAFYGEIEDPVRCAAIVGHKLHGTGGNLGLTELSGLGARLSRLAEDNQDAEQLLVELKAVKLQLQQTLDEMNYTISFRGISDNKKQGSDNQPPMQ